MWKKNCYRYEVATLLELVLTGSPVGITKLMYLSYLSYRATFLHLIFLTREGLLVKDNLVLYSVSWVILALSLFEAASSIEAIISILLRYLFKFSMSNFSRSKKRIEQEIGDRPPHIRILLENPQVSKDRERM